MATISERTTRKRHLLNLPQEVQDMIFEFAYSRSPEVKLRSRREWSIEELSKYNASRAHALRPFPQVKISEFLVSKSYFVAASVAYTEEPFTEGVSFAIDGLLMTPACGIIPSFAREVVLSLKDLVDITLTAKMPNLNKVKFVVTQYSFRDLWPEYVSQDKLSKEGFDTMQIQDSLCRIAFFLRLIGFPEKGRTRRREFKERGRQGKAFLSAFQQQMSWSQFDSPLASNGLEGRRRVPLYSGSTLCFDTGPMPGSKIFKMPEHISEAGCKAISGSSILRVLLDCERMLRDGVALLEPEDDGLLVEHDASAVIHDVPSMLGKRRASSGADDLNIKTKKIRPETWRLWTGGRLAEFLDSDSENDTEAPAQAQAISQAIDTSGTAVSDDPRSEDKKESRVLENEQHHESVLDEKGLSAMPSPPRVRDALQKQSNTQVDPDDEKIGLRSIYDLSGEGAGTTSPHSSNSLRRRVDRSVTADDEVSDLAKAVHTPIFTRRTAVLAQPEAWDKETDVFAAQMVMIFFVAVALLSVVWVGEEVIEWSLTLPR